MDSESDWDTQSETAASPRQNHVRPGINPDHIDIDTNSLYIDYRQKENSSQDHGQQMPSTQRVVYGNQSEPTLRMSGEASNQQARYSKSANQNAQGSNVGAAAQVNDSYHHSDDEASVDTVIQHPKSRSGSARTPRSQGNLAVKSRDAEPPFDFSRAYKPDSKNSRTSGATKIPGNDRTRATYDPAIQDDVDDDAVLAELRAGIQRGKQLEDEARRKQQLENQRKQMELQTELEEISQDDMYAKDKILARMSSLASKIKGGSKKETKQKNEKNVKDVEGGVGTAKPFMVEDSGGTVLVFPFDAYEKEYYRTVSSNSSAVLPAIADRVEKAMKRVWQEVFALVRIITSLVFVLLIEFIQYLLRDIVHGVILRIVSIFGDYLVKASLTTLFNGFLQPILIFVWNVLIGLRHALEPIVSLLRGISQQIALMLGAFRLVEINHNHNAPQYPYNNNYAYSEYSEGVENV